MSRARATKKRKLSDAERREIFAQYAASHQAEAEAHLRAPQGERERQERNRKMLERMRKRNPKRRRVRAKRNPSQVAKVQARGGRRFIVATDSKETNEQLLNRVNAVRVIKRINTNGVVEAAAGLQALEYLGSKVAPMHRLKVAPTRRRNSAAPDEWDDLEWDEILDEGSRLGSQEARALGHSVREERARRASVPKRYHVTWYSKMRGKRTGFIMPIEALNSREAIRQAKAMITNEKTVSNFVAKEVKRNPRTWAINANVSAKIAQLVREGVPHNKAVAIAFSEKRAGKVNPDFEVDAVPTISRKTVTVKALTQGSAVRKARRQLGSNAKAYALSVRKANPSTRDMSERFNGHASGAVVELKAADSAPGNLSRAGRLIFLKLTDRRSHLRIPGAVVCIDPKTERLWLAGTRTPMLNRKAKPGERLDFGEVDAICYETAKRHIEKGKLTEYVHSFGEDGGRKPRLHVDSEGMPLLVGGDYKIRREGIVN